MKLSRPKNITWWIAVVLGALGLIGILGNISALSGDVAFWLAFAGFLLLVIGTLFKNI